MKFYLTGQKLERIDDISTVANNSVDYSTAEFIIDNPRFKGNDINTINALFQNGDTETTYTVPISGNIVTIPADALTGDTLLVSLVALGDVKAYTTSQVKIKLEESGYDKTKTPSDPSASVYQQILTDMKGKQDKLTAGENITISENNVISATGGGSGVEYTAGDNIQISPNNVISATDTKYTAGEGIQISQENVISSDVKPTDIANINEAISNLNTNLNNKQNTLTAGNNIQINDNIISATDTKYTAGNNIQISPDNVISATSSGQGNTYSIIKDEVPETPNSIAEYHLVNTTSGQPIEEGTSIVIPNQSLNQGDYINIVNDTISVNPKGVRQKNKYLVYNSDVAEVMNRDVGLNFLTFQPDEPYIYNEGFLYSETNQEITENQVILEKQISYNTDLEVALLWNSRLGETARNFILEISYDNINWNNLSDNKIQILTNNNLYIRVKSIAAFTYIANSKMRLAIIPKQFSESYFGYNIPIYDHKNYSAPLIAGENIQISPDNVISATDTKYTAGENITISENNVISATGSQGVTYTAGNNIQISPDNVISATDTTYSAGIGIVNNNNVFSLDTSRIHTDTSLYYFNTFTLHGGWYCTEEQSYPLMDKIFLSVGVNSGYSSNILCFIDYRISNNKLYFRLIFPEAQPNNTSKMISVCYIDIAPKYD